MSFSMRVELPAAQITAEVKFLGSGVPATARRMPAIFLVTGIFLVSLIIGLLF
jgi:hypothetical protein